MRLHLLSKAAIAVFVSGRFFWSFLPYATARETSSVTSASVSGGPTAAASGSGAVGSNATTTDAATAHETAAKRTRDPGR